MKWKGKICRIDGLVSFGLEGGACQSVFSSHNSEFLKACNV